MGLVVSCTNNKSTFELHKSPFEDQNYSEQLRNSTRNLEINNNFKTEYQLDVTFLDFQFQKALNQRVQTLYETTNIDFVNSDFKTGFFVSIFSPYKSMMKLEDQSLWAITLKAQSKTYKPIKITKIRQKEKWKNFFPYINEWTSEYFILFDHDNSDETIGKLVKNTPTTLTFSNAKAKAILSWQ